MSIDNEYQKYLHSKETTSVNASFMEEVNASRKEIYEGQIWVHSDLIPELPPYFDASNIYAVNVLDREIPILQKYEKMELVQSDIAYSFTHPSFKNVVNTDYYDVIVYDADDSEIPYGLYDVVGSNIVCKPLIENFKLPLKATWISYIGEKGLGKIVHTDGSTPMVDSYRPLNPKDVATKEYVDTVNDAVKSILPKEPASVKDANIRVEGDIRKGSLVTTGDKVDFLFEDSYFYIESDYFVIKETGSIHLMMNEVEVWSISMEDIADGTFGKFSIATVDPYEDTPSSGGFYRSAKVFGTIRAKDFSNAIMNYTYPKVTFTIEYRVGQNIKEVSNDKTLFFDSPLESYNINAYISRFIGYESFVSGVPTLAKNSVLSLAASVSGVKKIMNPPLLEIADNFEDIIIENDSSYSSIFPVKSITHQITIPDDCFFDNCDIDLKAFNVLGEESASLHIPLSLRIDTVSDETLRVRSGVGPMPNVFGEEYNSAESLENNDELQLINGFYRWPSGNYKDFAKEFFNASSVFVYDWITGPNYDNLPDKVRYATFAFDIKECNGVFITLENLKNAEINAETRAFENISLHALVKNETGWLDAGSVYDGYGCPRNDEDAALVIQESSNDTKYITFGNKPIGGKLYVRVGFRNSAVTFSGIKIKTNY